MTPRTELKDAAMREELMEAAKRLQMTQVLEGMRFEASEGFTCTVYLL